MHQCDSTTPPIEQPQTEGRSRITAEEQAEIERARANNTLSKSAPRLLATEQVRDICCLRKRDMAQPA